MIVLTVWLGLSAIVLLVVNSQYRREYGSPVMIGTLAGLGLLGCGLLLPPVFFQVLLLVPIIALARAMTWKASTFAWATTLATVSVFAAVLTHAVLTQTNSGELEQSRLRAQYPYESMVERLPAPRTSASNKNLSTTTLTRLETQENIMDTRGLRRFLLQRLHEEHFDTFVSSVGFGAVRRIRPTESRLKVSEPLPDSPLPQRGPAFPLLLSAGSLGEKPAANELSSLADLHSNGFYNFFQPDSFGYIKDRRHVAGFEPHGFRQAPQQQRWDVQRVDLVGLLLRKEPVVYLTNGLPRMDQAATAPVRELDAFEENGLHELENGADLFVRDTPHGLRMLGALRALKQCTQCHDCQRGDLLGAFTYCLVKADR